MAGYPLDEFDQVPEGFSGSRANHRRQGVHREEPRATKKLGLWLIIATAIMALVIGAAAFFLLPRLGLGGSGHVAAPKPNNPGAATSKTTSPGPSSSAADASPSENPTTRGMPTAAVDRAIPIAVYNATAVAGLASSALDRIGQEGFARGEPANWEGPVAQSSVVYYREESQRPTAEAVARVLGIETVTQSNAREVARISVVLFSPPAGLG